MGVRARLAGVSHCSPRGAPGATLWMGNKFLRTMSHSGVPSVFLPPSLLSTQAVESELTWSEAPKSAHIGPSAWASEDP